MKIKIKHGTVQPHREYRLCEVADGECIVWNDVPYRMDRSSGIAKLIPVLRGEGHAHINVEHDMGEVMVSLIHTVKFIY